MASKAWSGARRLAQSFVKSLAGTDLTANAALSELRGAGLGYRRQDFLRDLSGFRRFFAQQGNVARVSGDRPVPRSWMVETEWDLASNFRYEFKAQIRNKATGQIEDVTRSMAHDTNLVKDKATEIFETEPPWEDYDYELVAGSLRLLGVGYRPDAFD